MAKRTRQRLNREDWLQGTLKVLEQHGVDGVKIVIIAERMGVTSGSFYWHFKGLRDLLDCLLEGGFGSGTDLFVAYSPEREDPGNPKFETSMIPKVGGGDGQTAVDLAATLFDQVVTEVIPESSPATALAVKLTENIFRTVNIALVVLLCLLYRPRRNAAFRESAQTAAS